jgi:hypothetical protein
MNSRGRWFVLVAAVLVVGTAGACGKDSPSPTDSASTPAATSAAGGSAEAFCAVVQQQKALLQGTQMPALLASGTADAWKTYLDQTAAMNQQLVDAAPTEIKASAKTLQDAALQLKSTMEAANYDVSKVGSAKLLQLLQTPERQTATAALVAFVQTKCGIDLTKANG